MVLCPKVKLNRSCISLRATVLDGMDEGNKNGAELMQAVKFADNQAMTANTKDGLQRKM